MLQEPHRLQKRKPIASTVYQGQLYTCARPGRSKGSKGPVNDFLVEAWINGLPKVQPTFLISLLGSKNTADKKSEFSFYTFRGGLEANGENDCRPTFQYWLDKRYREGCYFVFEYPTVDCEVISQDILRAVSNHITTLLEEGCTVVLFDSGGVSRVNRVCSYMQFA
jgi:hypothetical protein